MTLAERYAHFCATPSSINEHLPTLRRYAEQCESIAEFGVDIGQSTTAFLMAQPDYLWSIDIVPCPKIHDLVEAADSFERFEWKYVKARFGKTQWSFCLGDSRTFDLCDVDLLFIDSDHCYSVIKTELDRHHTQVRRYILIHDTFSYGDQGADGGKGIVPAIGEFLTAHPEWQEREHFKHNNGLQVLERVNHAD